MTPRTQSTAPIAKQSATRSVVPQRMGPGAPPRISCIAFGASLWALFSCQTHSPLCAGLHASCLYERREPFRPLCLDALTPQLHINKQHNQEFEKHHMQSATVLAHAARRCAATSASAPTSRNADCTSKRTTFRAAQQCHVHMQVFMDIGLCPDAFKPAAERRMGDASSLCDSPEPLGRLEIGLFGDAAPGTAARFEQLLTDGTYERTIFHRIKPGQYIQAGRQGQKRLGQVRARFAPCLERCGFLIGADPLRAAKACAVFAAGFPQSWLACCPMNLAAPRMCACLWASGLCALADACAHQLREEQQSPKDLSAPVCAACRWRLGSGLRATAMWCATHQRLQSFTACSSDSAI